MAAGAAFAYRGRRRDDLARPRAGGECAVYGEVLTLEEPLAQYRIHSTNSYQSQDLSPAQFARYLSMFELKLAYIEKRCASWGQTFDPEAAKRRSNMVLGMPNGSGQTVVTRRLSTSRIGRALRAVRGSPYGAKQRAALLAWLTAVAILPRGVAEHLIAYRFVVGRRPRWLERIVRLMTL